LEKHHHALALQKIHNARGKFGNSGFDETFDREEYDTSNAH
jgi:hypothetical protein